MTMLDHANLHAENAAVFEAWVMCYKKPERRDDERKDHIRWLELKAAQCLLAEAAARLEAVKQGVKP